VQRAHVVERHAAGAPGQGHRIRDLGPISAGSIRPQNGRRPVMAPDRALCVPGVTSSDRSEIHVVEHHADRQTSSFGVGKKAQS